jgi:hypothetical protein
VPPTGYTARVSSKLNLNRPWWLVPPELRTAHLLVETPIGVEKLAGNLAAFLGK